MDQCEITEFYALLVYVEDPAGSPGPLLLSRGVYLADVAFANVHWYWL